FAGAAGSLAAAAAACPRRRTGSTQDAPSAATARRSFLRVQGRITGDFVICSIVLILPSRHVLCQACAEMTSYGRGAPCRGSWGLGSRPGIARELIAQFLRLFILRIEFKRLADRLPRVRKFPGHGQFRDQVDPG